MSKFSLLYLVPFQWIILGYSIRCANEQNEKGKMNERKMQEIFILIIINLVSKEYFERSEQVAVF